jgi:polysaccharide export outer membrane protein
VVLACGILFAQAARPQVPTSTGAPGTTTPAAPGTTPTGQQTTDLTAPGPQLRSNYVLRAGDQILIRASDAEEISNRPFLIKEDGTVDLPLVGVMKAADLSLDSFEAALVVALKKFVLAPQVSVTVVQFSSEPVFFVGAFKAPGLYPLVGRRNLVEMITSVGGLQPTASNRIKVLRRKDYGAIPLPSAVTLPDGSTSVDINMTALQNNVNPAEDIVLQPFDVISVDIAEMIYVTGGGVLRPGAFPVGATNSMSVLQVLVLAGGLAPLAQPENSFILRPVMDTSRRAAIPVDLNKMLKGVGNDKPLLPNDVLYVASSTKLQTYQAIFPLLTLPLSMIALLSRAI